jgi:hypothetical protein
MQERRDAGITFFFKNVGASIRRIHLLPIESVPLIDAHLAVLIVYVTVQPFSVCDTADGNMRKHANLVICEVSQVLCLALT